MNKKTVVGRRKKNKTYTQFGYCLGVTLITVGFISFFLALGFTGSCEAGDITAREYIMRVVPCLTVFGSCALIYGKVF